MADELEPCECGNARVPMGPIIDSLGLTAHHVEGDLYSQVLVVLRVVNADGGDHIDVYAPPNMLGFERVSLLHLAHMFEKQTLLAYERD